MTKQQTTFDVVTNTVTDTVDEAVEELLDAFEDIDSVTVVFKGESLSAGNERVARVQTYKREQ